MIQIQARPYDTNWSGNSLYYKLYSDAALADTNTVFEVIVQFARNDETDFRALITLSLTPVNGAVAFNLQDIIAGQLIYDLPPINTLWMTGKQTGRFYIQYREINTATPNAGFVSTENQFVRQIVKGGIHIYQFNNNNFWRNFFPGYKPFLTWQKNGRLAGPKEPIYLAWYNNFVQDSRALHIGLTTVSLKIIVTYTDATTTTKNVALFTSVFPDLHSVVYIPVGATEQDLFSLQPTKKIWYWTAQLVNALSNNTPLSEIFNYQFDNRTDYNAVTLFYRNSLGGLDSLRVRGVIETDMDFETTEFESVLPPAYFLDPQLPPIQQMLPAKETVSYKGDIGYMGKDEQDRCREVFLTRETWLQKNNRWWPVEIISKNYKQRSSADKTYSLPIEWQLADGGSYYYTPGNVDLDTSFDGTNITPITITINNPAITFNGDNTVATVVQNYVVNLNGDTVDHLHFKIPGFIDDWTDIANGSVISRQLPVNRSLTIYMRAVDTSNIAGAIAAKAFNTNVGGGIVNNSNLYFNGDPTSFANVIITVSDLSGTENHDITIHGGEAVAFNVADRAGAVVKITFSDFAAFTCSLTTNGSTIVGRPLGGIINAQHPVFVFNAVTIINGITVNFT